jgi:adenosylmethionine-8-amino-7-oxononanoate aminotransferase
MERINNAHNTFYKSINVHPKVMNARVLGTILALELKTEEQSSYINEVRHKLYPFFLNKGILLRPLGNTIYIVPPYIIKNEELDTIYTAILELLEEL